AAPAGATATRRGGGTPRGLARAGGGRGGAGAAARPAGGVAGGGGGCPRGSAGASALVRRVSPRRCNRGFNRRVALAAGRSDCGLDGSLAFSACRIERRFDRGIAFGPRGRDGGFNRRVALAAGRCDCGIDRSLAFPARALPPPLD